MSGSGVLRQHSPRHRVLVDTGALTAAAGGRSLFATVTHHHIIVGNIEELPKRQLLVAAARLGVREIYLRRAIAIVEHVRWRAIDIDETSLTHNCQIDFFRIRLLLDAGRLTFLSVAVFR